MRQRGIYLFVIGILLTISLFWTGPVFALMTVHPDTDLGCEFAAGTSDVPSLGCLVFVIANIIFVAEMFVGAVALIFLLYGSILMIISRGDPKALEKAKKTITYAIFGVIAIFSIFIISGMTASALNIPNPLTRFSLYVP